jgi:hypothetical protein
VLVAALGDDSVEAVFVCAGGTCVFVSCTTEVVWGWRKGLIMVAESWALSVLADGRTTTIHCMWRW